MPLCCDDGLTSHFRSAAVVTVVLTFAWLFLLEAWGGYRRDLGYSLADEV